ncbi:MAG: DoxX family protein, partial [Chitinophagaceae bacterium]
MNTGKSLSGLFLRLSLGIVMLAHGLQQTLGLFGGNGFSGTMKYYTGFYHFPWIISLLGILSISIGAILLIIGLWGRIMAFLMGVFLLTAMFTVHVSNGFFMNWSGTK